MASATYKKELPQYEGEYIPVYISTMQNDLTFSEVELYSLVQGFSSGVGKNFARGYKDISNVFTFSKATLTRAFARLAGDERIVRVRGSRSMEYSTDEKPDGFFVREHVWTFHTLFQIKGIERVLRPTERRIFAIIYTFCTRKGANAYTVTYDELAEWLNISKKSVQRAIDALIAAKLVVRKEDEKGHRWKASTYHLHRRVQAIKEGTGKTSKATTEAQRAAAERANEIRNADARSDRERYYANLRSMAEAIAEKNVKRARQDKQYAAIESEISENVRASAKAEAFNLPTLAQLREKAKELKAQRAQRLAALGLRLRDLAPQYTCKKCSDTGFMTDGVACDCYNRRE